MSERPINFTADDVRAILDGRKTQVRKVVKLPLVNRQDQISIWVLYPGDITNPYVLSLCPFGQPGDRLWVREVWTAVRCSTDWETGYVDGVEEVAPNEHGARIWYRADYGFDDTYREDRDFRWRSPIYMPRRASRITLEITDVRVERVQEISEEDARAEGIRALPLQDSDDPSAWWQSSPGRHQARTARGSYRMLWDALNAKRGHGWDANPWVWGIAFEVVK